MKIAVFGFYNHLNAGDDRLQYVITRLLEEHSVIFLPHYEPVPISMVSNFDWILIGGGGLIFEEVGVWRVDQWINKVSCKIGVLGVGVNHVSDSLKNNVLKLVARSSFFYVRDVLSKQLLDNNEGVVVMNDLSWMYPIPQNPQASTDTIALNLLYCHWKEFDIDKWVNEIKKYAVLPFPFHFGKGQDYSLLRKYFNNVPTEFTLSPILSSKILIACRFHAILFAMQIHKPFVAINYDVKIERLLREADLEDLMIETSDPEHLNSKIQYVFENYERIKSRITDFSTAQKSKAELMKENLLKFINEKPNRLSLYARIVRRFNQKIYK